MIFLLILLIFSLLSLEEDEEDDDADDEEDDDDDEDEDGARDGGPFQAVFVATVSGRAHANGPDRVRREATAPVQGLPYYVIRNFFSICLVVLII